jgi:hypothetical protein
LLFLRLRVVLLFAWLSLPLAAAAEGAPPWRVLILLGSDYSLPASVVEANAIRTTLAAGTLRRVEFYTEALDAYRMPLAEYEADFAGFMQRKYRGRPMDIVIAVQAAALDFVERHRAELWPGTPVVFCAMPADWVRGRTFAAGITGVTATLDPVGTLDLALRLQPDARQVVVVGGVGEIDRAFLGGARQAMLVLHDDAKREYVYGPAQGLPDTRVGTFTQALYDQAQKQGRTVISMKNDWKKIFAFE